MRQYGQSLFSRCTYPGHTKNRIICPQEGSCRLYRAPGPFLIPGLRRLPRTPARYIHRCPGCSDRPRGSSGRGTGHPPCSRRCTPVTAFFHPPAARILHCAGRQHSFLFLPSDLTSHLLVFRKIKSQSCCQDKNISKQGRRITGSALLPQAPQLQAHQGQPAASPRPLLSGAGLAEPLYRSLPGPVFRKSRCRSGARPQ